MERTISPPPLTSDLLDLVNVIFVHGYVAGMGLLLDFLDTKETEAAYSIKKGCDVA